MDESKEQQEFEYPPGGSVVDVNSSNIEQIRYYGGSKGEMYVQFVRGGIYRYEGVRPATYLALLEGEVSKGEKKPGSIGSAFHRLIKVNKEKYPYERVG